MIAARNSHLARLSPRLEEPYSRIPHHSVQNALMPASTLFAGLSASECSEILLFARMRTFVRHEILFSQGQLVNTLVLIQSGSVKLTQVSFAGNEVILWMNGCGDALEVHNNASDDSHSCSARAMETCQTLVWEYSCFQSLVAQFPRIGANILKILDDRLRELEQRFHEI